MKAVIFDIDGTLANLDHRLHHLPNWDKFFAEMHNDTPIPEIKWLANQLAAMSDMSSPENDYCVLIVSARPDNYRDVTENWLLKHGIDYHRLYMRKAGDFRKDSIVKKEILQQITEDGFEPFLVIDDRAQVVAMWREYGLMTLQCAPNEKPLSKYEGQCLFHMMVGPSGAGKSTYIGRNYKSSDVVSTDDIRVQLFGSKELGFTPEDLNRTWNYAHGLIRTRLENGVFTVLDATNIKRKDRLKVLEYVPKGQLVQYVMIDRDLNTKLKDRDWRPEHLVLRHHQTFQSNIKDILKADDQGNVIVVDMREKK